MEDSPPSLVESGDVRGKKDVSVPATITNTTVKAVRDYRRRQRSRRG